MVVGLSRVRPAVDVPHVAAVVAGVVMVLASTMAFMSLALPWWSGPEAAGITNDGTEETGQIETDSSIGLFSFSREFQVDEEPMSKEADWDSACVVIEVQVMGGDVTCLNIKTMRALVIVGGILFIISAGLMFVAFAVLPLLQLPAGLIGMGGAAFEMVATALAVTMQTTGITMGCGCCVGSMMMSAVGVAFAVYGGQRAIRAMDPGLPEHVPEGTGTRQERMQQKMDEAEASARALEDGLRSSSHTAAQRPQTPQSARELDPDDAGSIGSAGDRPVARKHPVILEQIIYWADNHDDEEEIPTDMLVKAFREIDEDMSGVIDVEELVDALQMCGLKASKAATDVIMQEIDKNASGDIDIHEFVGFFRHIEDMNQFQKRAQQKAQFVSFLMNCCFLCDILVVCALLMIFIRAEDQSGDDYKILRTVLMVASFWLALLFCCVIAFPALRLTIQPSVAAWYRAQDARPRRTKKKVVEELPERTHWKANNPDGIPPPPSVAQMGTSYRLKHTNQMMATQFKPKQTQDFMNNTGTLSLPGALNEPYADSEMLEVPGMVVDDAGQPLRYDPSSFRMAKENQATAKSGLRSFSSMQVRDIHVTREQDGANLALTNG